MSSMNLICFLKILLFSLCKYVLLRTESHPSPICWVAVACVMAGVIVCCQLGRVFWCSFQFWLGFPTVPNLRLPFCTCCKVHTLFTPFLKCCWLMLWKNHSIQGFVHTAVCTAGFLNLLSNQIVMALASLHVYSCINKCVWLQIVCWFLVGF